MDQDPKWYEVMFGYLEEDMAVIGDLIVDIAFAGEEAIPACKETVRFLTAAHAQQEDF